ncbi:hypothetical protein, partial [Bifidobacterium longum]|uniref:hypothetical protein n=1 Tax=Bifidobacterium longum TaxID=216816 RepID=UPI001CFFF579
MALLLSAVRLVPAQNLVDVPLDGLQLLEPLFLFVIGVIQAVFLGDKLLDLGLQRFPCLCSISCCGFSHDDFSGLGRACRPRNGLNWMVLVSPPERTGK